MEAGDSSEAQLPEYDFDPDRLNLRVRVTLAADRKAVDPVVEQVMEAIRETKCLNGKEDAIELALQEALANAVVHGAKEDPTKLSNAWLRAMSNAACSSSSGTRARVSIRSTFQAARWARISIPITVAVYFLINQLMDEVQFRKNGTEIHMVKH